jgi:hypothetical protein
LQFFSRIYEYHQGGGFLCICLKHVFGLLQFLFVVGFSTFLLQCVDYKVLFNERRGNETDVMRKRTVNVSPPLE